jgi:hypothetical protein
VRSRQFYSAVRPVVAKAPKGRQAVAWWRKPQVRAKPNHRPSLKITFTQAPKLRRHRCALQQPSERRRAGLSSFAAMSLLRSSVLRKTRGACAAQDPGPGAYATKLRLAAAFAAPTGSSTFGRRCRGATNSAYQRPTRSPIHNRLSISRRRLPSARPKLSSRPPVNPRLTQR